MDVDLSDKLFDKKMIIDVTIRFWDTHVASHQVVRDTAKRFSVHPLQEM
jgi:hypothetical protein